MPSAATLETSRMATIPRLQFPAFGERSKATGIIGSYSVSQSVSVYLCPICLGPLSFAINSAVGIAGSVVMLIVPRDPKSTDK